MDAEISQSEQWLRILAWIEDNWRRVAMVGGAVIAVGIVVAFVVWQGNQKQRNAAEALSLLYVSPGGPTGEALAGFAEAHGGTAAATRARFLSAVGMFTDGRYADAQQAFERILSEETVGPLFPMVRLGIAACKEAQGQSDAAITDYAALVENPSSGHTIPQARFALAKLYLDRGDVELAREQYEELSKVHGRSLAPEARNPLMTLPPSTASRQVEVPPATMEPAAATPAP